MHKYRLLAAFLHLRRLQTNEVVSFKCRRTLTLLQRIGDKTFVTTSKVRHLHTSFCFEYQIILRIKNLSDTTVALNVGGDGGNFQSFVFVSEQEILSRKPAILSAETNNLAIPFYLEMEEIDDFLVVSSTFLLQLPCNLIGSFKNSS